MSQPGDTLSFGEKLRYGAEAAVFFAFMAFFKVLGLETASRLGGWIGRNILSLLPPDKVARRNLALAFPEKSDAERNAIRRAMWDNLGRVVGEYPHLDRFSPNGEDPRITYSLPAGMTVEAMKGRPLMFLSGHLANWEVMPILAAQVGLQGATVVRHPNNPYVARWISRQRALRGPKEQIGKHSGARRIFAQLRGGKVIYMLVDQRNDEGIAVPFFGRDAMTTPVPAALALKLGARILIARNQRLGRSARFRVTVGAAPGFVPSGDETADTRSLTEVINAEVEAIVRQEPSQWLWIHNRWK
jgi:KDO2-lipid IV(A) lauroyltransferase